MSVEVIDRGLNLIKRELRLADGSFAKVGFPIGANVGSSNKKSLTKLESYSNISEVASVAVFQNFGTRRIPQREFMASSFDENLDKLNRFVVREYKKITQGVRTTRQSLGLIGEFATAIVKKKIVSLETPPNAPATIAKKKSSNPLIDTAQMLNSVTHVTVMRG